MSFGLRSILFLTTIEILAASFMVLLYGPRTRHELYYLIITTILVIGFQAFMQFNIIKVGRDSLRLVFLCNPFKRDVEVGLSQVNKVIVTNYSTRIGGVSIRVIYGSTERTISTVAFRKEITNFHKELTQRNIDIDLVFL